MKESLDAFKASLEDRPLMAGFSQLAASSISRHLVSDALGVNPFIAPRLDEEHPITLEQQSELAGFGTTDRDARGELTLPDEILNSEGFGVTARKFQLHPDMPWYGLWAVANQWKNVSDLPSIKEQRSYLLLERPYKFLQNTDKQTVDKDTEGATQPVRTQVPVLLDFHEGRIYIENTNKKLIYMIIIRLKQLGVEVFPVAWMYPQPNWPSVILTKLYEGSQFRDEFMKRAEEAKRFSPKEIEKLEDREMEGIVSEYFSMTELGSELWIGISTPTQVQLQETSPAIGVKAPTSATTLLHITNESSILAGNITFQSRITFMAKDGIERTFRKDLFTLDLNDKINLTDVGAAMLRGFNLPTLKKDIQREIKQTQQVPTIEQFWGNWLLELNNAVRTIEASFREILDIDGDQAVGIQPVNVPGKEEAVTETVGA